MDKLAKQLRSDAEQIDVAVSPELQHRIDASLRAVTPETAVAGRSNSRPATFWWASSLTGLAAAIAVISYVNLSPVSTGPAPSADRDPSTSIADSVSDIDWEIESAMLTHPLRAELAALQSDIKKAEQKVKDDIGL